jgi:hypothetical protein
LTFDPKYGLFFLDAAKVVLIELFYFAFPHKGDRLLAALIQSHIVVEAPIVHKK